MSWLIIKLLSRLPISAKLDEENGNWGLVIVCVLIDIYIIAMVADMAGIRIVLG